VYKTSARLAEDLERHLTMHRFAARAVCALVFASCSLVAACGDDGTPLERDPDGGRAAGSVDATVDASTHDPRDGGRPEDARVGNKPDASLDASTSCTLGQGYRYGGSGGLVSYTDQKELTADGEYRRARTPVRDKDAGMPSCAVALPACDGSGVDAADLAAALGDPVVVSAFGDGSKVFGYDERPVDGQVLWVERQDGKHIAIGDPCDGRKPCEPIPAPLATLQRLLDELDAQQSRTDACAAFR
jgi:hypothetical protein